MQLIKLGESDPFCWVCTKSIGIVGSEIPPGKKKTETGWAWLGDRALSWVTGMGPLLSMTSSTIKKSYQVTKMCQTPSEVLPFARFMSLHISTKERVILLVTVVIGMKMTPSGSYSEAR